MPARSYGQFCGLTRAVELVGERWAMLIVRDLLVGPRRFTDLLRGLPRIPTNILTTRLKELQAGGVIRRVPLGGRGVTYELTPYGRELEPIVLALGRWGFAAMREPGPNDVVTPDSLTMALRTAFRPGGRAAYEVHLGDVALAVRVDGELLDIVQLTGLPPVGGRAELPEPGLAFEAGPQLRELIAGTLSPAAALATGAVRVLRGDPALLDDFAATFHIDPGL